MWHVCNQPNSTICKYRLWAKVRKRRMKKTFQTRTTHNTHPQGVCELFKGVNEQMNDE